MAILRIRTVFTGLPGLPGVSDIYFRDTISTDAADCHAAVSLMWSELAPIAQIELVVDVEGTIASINEETGNLIEYHSVTPTQYDGSQAGTTQLPYANQAVLKFKTTGLVHNRLVQGRIFLPGLTEGSSDAGVPTSAFVTSAQAAMENLDTPTSQQVVWSRPFAGTVENPARDGSAYSVTSRGVMSQWGVLRSRRP
uniref:Uncharacterized protein n=1 Tax=uncultured prokaryote TaxID=198431 RepID=A0A0H5Q5Z3_9ZZZZ|nr:hypothetical protein [uncultured prokaryote]